MEKQRINPINALTTLIANKSQITDKNGKIKKKYQRTNIKLPKNKKEKVSDLFGNPLSFQSNKQGDLTPNMKWNIYKSKIEPILQDKFVPVDEENIKKIIESTLHEEAYIAPEIIATDQAYLDRKAKQRMKVAHIKEKEIEHLSNISNIRDEGMRMGLTQKEIDKQIKIYRRDKKRNGEVLAFAKQVERQKERDEAKAKKTAEKMAKAKLKADEKAQKVAKQQQQIDDKAEKIAKKAQENLDRTYKQQAEQSAKQAERADKKAKKLAETQAYQKRVVKRQSDAAQAKADLRANKIKQTEAVNKIARNFKRYRLKEGLKQFSDKAIDLHTQLPFEVKTTAHHLHSIHENLKKTKAGKRFPEMFKRPVGRPKGSGKPPPPP